MQIIQKADSRRGGKWKIFPIGEERRVGPDVGLDFLSLVLQDRGAQSQQRMVVLAGQRNGFVERDVGGPRGNLAERQAYERKATKHRASSEEYAFPRFQDSTLNLPRPSLVRGVDRVRSRTRHKT